MSVNVKQLFNSVGINLNNVQMVAIQSLLDATGMFVEEYTGTSVELQPNTWYVNSTSEDTLTITLSDEWFSEKECIVVEDGEVTTVTKNVINHYWVDCILGDNATITLPEGTQWHDSVVPINAGHYQIAIINGIAGFVRVDVESNSASNSNEE